ncbi:MAG: PilZ domain-containing protein [Rhodospirillales bacterium]|nr:PilZ domain-containing protein [Rhodospirillales bacterium]
MSEKPFPINPAERRVHRRFPVLWSATMTAESALAPYVLNCDIRNISISGLHVLAERTLAAGTAVSLHIDRVGGFRGSVAWSAGDRLGIAFDESPERVAELIRDHV